jgi:Brinker DNA-binding domain
VTDSYQNYILSFIIRINHFSVKMTSARKETHSAYTSSFKLKVISVAETRGKHFASKHFNVDRKRVREWCKTKSEIEMQAKSADVEIAEQVLDNVEISESDGECSSVLESADSATDYDSPGH